MIAVAGILATDPNFPAKRIHIPQYFILALVLHRALSFDLPAPWIFPGAVLFAAVLGVHDELIQGLLPSRTFGLRDIGVNSLGALSGGAVGAGLSLFAARVNKDLPTPNGATLFGIGAVVIGLALMLAPLEYFRDASIPVWTITPLLAAGFALCLISWRDPFSRTRPFAVFILITMTLPLYLLLSHANTLNFH
ncbi:MAG: VanZ family protein [Rhodospirillaceae bacterium]|nr:VanZ family protein [Rhodospirillaceae bacterium]MBT5812555.1 VanZ family protein [Rhodospirillaceae bacterium]